MARIRLTTKTIESLKAGSKQQDYFDTSKGSPAGFSLRVTPAGIKSYSLLYRHYGKLRRLTIGTTDRWTLADARKAASDALTQNAKGTDPATEKVVERQAESFEELKDAYLSKKKKRRSDRETKRILDTYFKKLNPVRAKDVKRAQVCSILDDISKDAPIQSNRALAAIRGCYNWGISRGLVESNPCTLVPQNEEEARDRVLDEAEIKLAWKAIDAEIEETGSYVGDTYKVRLLTLQRAGEVLTMKWSEIDLPERHWTIPKERSKNNKPHRVWLADPVVRILEAAQQRNQERTKRSGGPSKWVFPGKRKGQHLMETKRVMDSIRGRLPEDMDHWYGHDLRRTGATMMAKLGISEFVIGKVLNHSESIGKDRGPQITSTYNQFAYDDEKREALEKWASHLMRIVSDLKVVETSAGHEA